MSYQDGKMNVIYVSEAMQEVVSTALKIAKYDSPVLITGESGTGKEVIADLIHYSSPRKDGPFIKSLCPANTEELFESHFFGRVKGSYTGSTRDAKGYFAQADKGTIFLDEFFEMPSSFQIKLLRALEGKGYRPVGGQKDEFSDFRIICASNYDLEKATISGKLRTDLLSRVEEISIHLPPLRQRKEDIPCLANFFLEEASKKYDKKMQPLSSECLEHLTMQDWPRNVRQLRSAIFRATQLSEGIQIEIKYIGKISEDGPKVSHLPFRTIADTKRDLIIASLRRNDGNKMKSAKELGIGRATLYVYMRKHGLSELNNGESITILSNPLIARENTKTAKKIEDSKTRAIEKISNEPSYDANGNGHLNVGENSYRVSYKKAVVKDGETIQKTRTIKHRIRRDRFAGLSAEQAG